MDALGAVYTYLEGLVGPVWATVVSTIGTLGGIGFLIGIVRTLMWALDRMTGAQKNRRAEFDADVQRVLSKDNGEFLDDLRILLSEWLQNRRLSRAMRKMEKRYEKRRRRFRKDMRDLAPSLVD